MKHVSEVEVSKYMSYLLRHEPENLEVDGQGFVGLEEFVRKIRERFQVDERFILGIVEKSGRKRFEIINNRIRALYGHTITVELAFEEDRTIRTLYHGTSPDAASRILEMGLKSMKRRWVHLSPTVGVAREVGLRKTRQPVILKIDADAARTSGVEFYKASDKVYLCRDLSPEYISPVETN